MSKLVLRDVAREISKERELLEADLSSALARWQTIGERLLEVRASMDFEEWPKFIEACGFHGNAARWAMRYALGRGELEAAGALTTKEAQQVVRGIRLPRLESGKTQERRQRVQALAAANPELTINQLAALIGVSDSSIKLDLLPEEERKRRSKAGQVLRHRRLTASRQQLVQQTASDVELDRLVSEFEALTDGWATFAEAVDGKVGQAAAATLTALRRAEQRIRTTVDEMNGQSLAA